jgi:hypothetical protein
VLQTNAKFGAKLCRKPCRLGRLRQGKGIGSQGCGYGGLRKRKGGPKAVESSEKIQRECANPVGGQDGRYLSTKGKRKERLGPASQFFHPPPQNRPPTGESTLFARQKPAVPATALKYMPPSVGMHCTWQLYMAAHRPKIQKS